MLKLSKTLNNGDPAVWTHIDSVTLLMLQILTKDSVTVFVNAIMFYKVKDPISAVANVDDYSASARLLSATTLRNVLGTKSLKEILSERETIARDMQVRDSVTLRDM